MTRPAWAALAAAWAVLAAASCESSLSLDEVLRGRPCRAAQDPAGQCVAGYECNTSNMCVPLASGQGGGSESGGSGGSSGSGDGGNAGSSGTASGGATQQGGSGGTSAGGSAQGGDAGTGGSLGQGGSNITDAAVPPADGGCVPGPLYRDRDGDGYGSEAPGDVEFGCALQGYVTIGQDCHDVEPSFFDRAELVHPGQTEYFAFSYVDANGPGGISFDFDCSGAEEADPTNDPPNAQPNCPNLLGGLACTGSGFRDEGRSGPGVIGQCGSEFIVDCATQAITQCVAQERLAPDRPFSCR